MKILYVLGSFFPAQNGGPNNTVYWAASEMATQGVDVSVVSLKDGLTAAHIQSYKIKLGGLTRFNGLRVYFFSYVISRYFAFSMYFWLFRNIRTFDGVMLTSIFFPISWYSAILCLFYKVPFSIAPRGELEPGALVFKKLLKIFLLRLFIISLMSRAKYIVVTSKQEKRSAESFFSDKMVKKLVPNFMVMPDFQLPQVKVQAPLRTGFLYLGRVHPKKGLENLIDAFDIISDGNKILTIAGDGETSYVASLKARVRSKRLDDRIRFIGHVEGVAKANLYKCSRALVLPSFSENFGNVVVEALSFALPVIASKHTPWREIQAKKSGYWIDNSPSSLAAAIEIVNRMGEPEYAQMSVNAHRLAREQYDVNSKGSLLKHLVLDLVS